MKGSAVKLWHGFLYGIGASIAWWLVFGLMGLVAYKQYISEYMPQTDKQKLEEKSSENLELKKHLQNSDLQQLEIPRVELP